MMVNLKDNNQGMTLLELLLALGLLGLVASGLMTMYWLASYTFEHETGRSDVQYAARQSVEKIIQDLRSSDGFHIIPGEPELAPGETGQCLCLEKEEEVRQVNTPCRVYFYMENNQLYKECRRLKDNTFVVKIPIAENITRVLFSSPAPGLVNIKIDADNGSNKFSLETSSNNRVD